MGLIYMATCRIGGKSYIGQTIQSLSMRKNRHESTARRNLPEYCSAFASAIRKYGPDQFDWKVLEECPPDELNEREVAAIAKYGTLAPQGYNLRPGGSGVEVHKRHRRKNESDADLPQHIVRYTHPTGSGYRVMLPDGRRKAFMNKHYSDQEKLKMAEEWLDKAMNDAEHASTGSLRKYAQDNALPPGVTRHMHKGRSKDTYRITAGNGKDRVTQDFTSKEKALDTYDAMQALLQLSGDPEVNEAAETLLMLKQFDQTV